MNITNKEKYVEILNNAHDTLGLGLKDNNEDHIKKAEDLYTTFLASYPDHPDANHNLGIIFNRRNELKEALSYYSKAVENSSYPVAQFYISRATCKFHLKEHINALEDLNEAEKIEKDNPKVILNKGIVLRLLGEEDKAFPYIHKYYLNNKGDPQAINRLAYHFLVKENHKEAQRLLGEAINIDPNHYDSIMNYANSCNKSHSRKEAKQYFEKALLLRPNDPIAHLNYGAFFQEGNKPEEALRYYMKSLELSGENIHILHNIGTIYGELGSEKAAEYYRKALKLQPNYYASFRALCYTRTLKEDDNLLLEMEKNFLNEDINELDRAEIGHGLAFAYDNLKVFNKAIKFINFSNSTLRKSYAYDNKKQIELVDKLKNVFTKESFSKIPKSNDTGAYSPIFIVGMPRSGTSLVEQVLVNHSKIRGCGELVYLPDSIRDISGYPESINSWNENYFSKFNNEYCNKVAELLENDTEKIITDKMPYNFWNVGFIKKAFPESKIIMCNRDLRDTITSLYILRLTGGHPFIFDKKELLDYSNAFFDLAKYWKDLLLDDLYVFDYEKFIDNKKIEGEKLFKYLELEFDEKFLEIEKNTVGVRTASNFQVKKKINNSSINRWKNYSAELSEIFDNLKGYKL